MANSKRRCRECKKYSVVECGLVLNGGYYCERECAVRYAIANKEQGKRIKHREQKRAFKANDKALRLKKAQAAFNAFIRARDADQGCISCDKDKNWQGQWHAGHFKTTKARPDIRFNEDNCHKQCSVCNNHLSGNIGEYTPRLISKIGLERYEALLCESLVKYSCEELKEVMTTYNEKAAILR